MTKLTMESLKDSLREKLSEANVKSSVSGTSLAKLPKNIKRILVDELKISARHMNQVYFDKHLKQLIIVINPRVFNRSDIQFLMDSPEFLYLEFINDIEHQTGLAIAFKYSEMKKKTKLVKTDEYNSETDENVTIKGQKPQDIYDFENKKEGN